MSFRRNQKMFKEYERLGLEYRDMLSDYADSLYNCGVIYKDNIWYNRLEQVIKYPLLYIMKCFAMNNEKDAKRIANEFIRLYGKSDI